MEEGGSIRGMELLSVTTVLQKEKRRCQTEGSVGQIEGPLQGMSGKAFRGYEIHMGKTLPKEEAGEALPENQPVIRTGANPNVYGSYVHGLFDQAQIAGETVQALAKKMALELGCDADEETGFVSTDISMDRGQALHIDLALTGDENRYEVRSWYVYDSGNYEIDDFMPVWDGK